MYGMRLPVTGKGENSFYKHLQRLRMYMRSKSHGHNKYTCVCIIYII